MPLNRPAAVVVAVLTPAASAQYFQLLQPPTGEQGTVAVEGISHDGEVAFGRTLSDCNPTPIRWVRQGTGIDPQSLGFANGLPRASAANGSAFAGDTNCDTNPDALCWWWSQDTGIVPLSTVPVDTFEFLRITSLSGDGTIVAGYGLDSLEAEPRVAFKVGASPIVRIDLTPVSGPLLSADGSTIVFIARPEADPFTRLLHRYTIATGQVTAGTPVGLSSTLLSVSDDGQQAFLQQAFNGPLYRHTAALGLQVASTMGCCPGFATDATPDGTRVVGLTFRGAQSVGYIWDATNGVRYLDTLLTSLGVDLTGIALTSAVAISADGTAIVGAGTPSAWIADLDFVPPCDPDYDQNGVADQDDVAYLINVIAGGENPTGRDPDFDQNGVADQDDTAALVDVVAGGPCPT